ncbi:STAS domain-containing protein [Desulfovibrio sp. JC022]|uniref:STAS domain-containing protein n=1 Tax=Desulfovibrio sp. JC022 TaxID=2593642 RepID=UPI0013D82C05|nr:STAS domain-containing protein [Desulfovibrio sp. JC022]NDV22048.1 STAS domain-containing protein [Desulfovibrio sp. JC022]
MRDFHEIQIVDGCLIAPVPAELEESVLEGFRRNVLEQVCSRSVKRVLMDVSSREILDSSGYTAITDCARMIGLLGAEVVFVGFQPGVVSALIDLDVDMDGLTCACTMEDGLSLFRAMDVPDDPEDDGDGEQDMDSEELFESTESGEDEDFK